MSEEEDMRLTFDASGGAPSAARAASRVLAHNPHYPKWEEWDDDLTDDAIQIARALVKANDALKAAFEFIADEYSSPASAALDGDPLAPEARAVRDTIVAALFDGAAEDTTKVREQT